MPTPAFSAALIAPMLLAGTAPVLVSASESPDRLSASSSRR